MKEDKLPNKLPDSVVLREVVLRDGLQNEKKVVHLRDKIDLLYGLIEAGLRDLEIASFVNPMKVPTMADADELFLNIKNKTGVRLSALIFNLKGLERAKSVGVEEVAIFVSASDTHSLRNMGKTVDEALKDTERLIPMAKDSGIKVRAGVSNAFGCALEGKIPPEKVLNIVESIAKSGSDEIGLADTSGMANPAQIWNLIPRCRDIVQDRPISLHLHDASGWGFANLIAAMEEGINIFDTALGGTGGCPFLPDARGNLATERVNRLLLSMGIKTGIDEESLNSCLKRLESILGRTLWL